RTEHRTWYDRPFAGADGRPREGHVLRGSRPHHPRCEHAHGAGTMSQAVLKIKPEGRGLPSPTIVAFVFLLAAAAAAAMWLVHQLADPTALPSRRVQIEGEFVHLQPQRLQAIVENAVDAGFFGVDVAMVRKRLLEEPWLRDATSRRVWPDTLRVNVIEQVP